ncbi:MAG: holo-ACP synthase [Deltaproteobacteria bacterium]|nr:holo-ACP synthase [Deltaproteobacteria bacterium]
MPDIKDILTEKRHLEEAAMKVLADAVGEGAFGLGVDIQRISDINYENSNFLERNFTPAEITYCRAAPDVAASFAGRWAAKEAVVKAKMNLFPEGGNSTKGGAAPLIDIEILPGESGAPIVVQHGHPAETSLKLGISRIKVSISHSGDYAAAAAVALSKASK